MTQKTTLFLAAALTAFVLIGAGAVANRVTQAAAIVPTMLPVAVQPLEQPVNAGAQTASLAEPVVVQPQATDVPQITVQDAADIALNYAPVGATLLRAPELVSFEGVLAYEARLDLGMVYIAAADGTILYDNIQLPQSPNIFVRENEHSDSDGDD